MSGYSQLSIGETVLEAIEPLRAELRELLSTVETAEASISALESRLDAKADEPRPPPPAAPPRVVARGAGGKVRGRSGGSSSTLPAIAEIKGIARHQRLHRGVREDYLSALMEWRCHPRPRREAGGTDRDRPSTT